MGIVEDQERVRKTVEIALIQLTLTCSEKPCDVAAPVGQASAGHPISSRVNVYKCIRQHTGQQELIVPPRCEMVCLSLTGKLPREQSSCWHTRIVSQAALACPCLRIRSSGKEISRCVHPGRLVVQPSSKPCPPCKLKGSETKHQLRPHLQAQMVAIRGLAAAPSSDCLHMHAAASEQSRSASATRN